MCTVLSLFLWFPIIFTNYLLLLNFQDGVAAVDKGGKGVGTSSGGGGDKDKVQESQPMAVD